MGDDLEAPPVGVDDYAYFTDRDGFHFRVKRGTFDLERRLGEAEWVTSEYAKEFRVALEEAYGMRGNIVDLIELLQFALDEELYDAAH